MEYLKGTKLRDYITGLLSYGDSYIVSPFIKFPTEVELFLFVTSSVFVTRPDQVKYTECVKPKEVYVNKNLHSKIYLNHKGCVITSMNLYDFSFENNHETGIFFEKNEKGYKEAKIQIKEIINESIKII